MTSNPLSSMRAKLKNEMTPSYQHGIPLSFQKRSLFYLKLYMYSINVKLFFTMESFFAQSEDSSFISRFWFEARGVLVVSGCLGRKRYDIIPISLQGTHTSSIIESSFFLSRIFFLLCNPNLSAGWCGCACSSSKHRKHAVKHVCDCL